jgi:hypothetical protein
MKNTKEIYKNLEFTYNKEENDAALEIYNMAKEQFPDDPVMVAMTMYTYGKQVGRESK